MGSKIEGEFVLGKPMIYVKSLLAGLGALIAYCLLFLTVGVRLLLPKPPDLPEGVGYISNSPWVPFWLVLRRAACFCGRRFLHV